MPPLGAVTGTMARFRFERVVNFAHIYKLKTASARGGRAEAVIFIGCLGGAMHPVAYHKLPRSHRFQGFRPARRATSWERPARTRSQSGHRPV